MEPITLILSLVCTHYIPEHLVTVTDYMNSKVQTPVVELSTSVLHKDILDVCRRNPDKSMEWVTDIILAVDRNNWKENGVGVIYTPTGVDYRIPTG